MPPEGAYEAERAARIARNKAKLAALGLGGPPAAGGSLLVPAALRPGQGAPGRRARSKPGAKNNKGRGAAAPAPSRRSKRQRGLAADGGKAAVDLDALERRAEARAREARASSGGASGRAKKPAFRVDGPPVRAPFTLRSIGVTVLDLGRIQRGPAAARWWSSAGCLYHHGERESMQIAARAAQGLTQRDPPQKPTRSGSPPPRSTSGGSGAWTSSKARTACRFSC